MPGMLRYPNGPAIIRVVRLMHHQRYVCLPSTEADRMHLNPGDYLRVQAWTDGSWTLTPIPRETYLAPPKPTTAQCDPNRPHGSSALQP